MCDLIICIPLVPLVPNVTLVISVPSIADVPLVYSITDVPLDDAIPRRHPAFITLAARQRTWSGGRKRVDEE
jgi:hypothetical protein